MKTFSLFFLFFCAFFCFIAFFNGTLFAAPDGDEMLVDGKPLPKLDLFLCIGQSNMAGRGVMDKEKGDLEPIPNVYLFTEDGKWEPARNPLNRYSNIRKEMSMQQISPAYGFALKLAAETKRPIGLVVNAKGGTRIEQWAKGSEDDFANMSLKRAKEAMKWGTFKGILWHQGEGNSGKPDEYPEKLKRMVEFLRTELGDEKLFFAAGELGQWREDNQKFNKMINGISTFLPNSGAVSTEGLKPLRGDVKDPHFDRESQIILGNRYADVISENVYKK